MVSNPPTNDLRTLTSSLYWGDVVHQRLGPIRHSFRYRVAMPLLYLDEIETVCNIHRGWSSNRRNLVEFRRSDFIAHPTLPGASIADAVAARLTAASQPVPQGRIAMLGNLRTFGWQFNPITLYFCFNSEGTSAEALVAEVTNTPWNQRHSYVVGLPGTHRMRKELHVSPFMPMHHEYEFSYDTPGDRLQVRMANYDNGALVFVATMTLKRVPLDASSARRYLATATSARVSLGIYREAAKLRRKGVAFVPHPDRKHRHKEASHAAK